MARRPSTPQRHPANLAPEQMKSAITRLEARLRELQNFDPQSITSGDAPEIQGLEARIGSTLSQVFGEDTHEFARLTEAANLDRTTYVLSLVGNRPGTSVQEIREG